MSIKIISMGRKSKLELPPINLGEEAFGRRIARLRKEQGLTQVNLAKKIGIIQQLVADYEADKLRMHAEMLARFANALNVSADELLGLKPNTEKFKNTGEVSLRIFKRLKKMEKLPNFQQKVLLQTIDNFLKGVGVQ